MHKVTKGSGWDSGFGFGMLAGVILTTVLLAIVWTMVR